MSEALKGIAARYASALKVAGTLHSSGGGGDRPTATDICLWKLEEVLKRLVAYPRHKPDSATGYDHSFLYAHRFCLKSAADVEAAPDDVLLEALRLGKSDSWGWLQFMIREGQWIALLAGNWGLPAIATEYGGGDAVKSAIDHADVRFAQAASYYCDLMRERGRDVLAELRESAEEYKAIHQIDEAALINMLRHFDGGWAHIVYTCRDVLKPEFVSKPGEVKYSGAHRAQMYAEQRRAAENRRCNRNAPHSCDCVRLQAEADECAGLEKEREHVEHVLKSEMTLPRHTDINVVPDGEILPRLIGHWEALASSEYHIRNAYLGHRLELFLARNEKARDMLRLPENRELALKVKNGSPDARMGEARGVNWLYLPE